MGPMLGSQDPRGAQRTIKVHGLLRRRTTSHVGRVVIVNVVTGIDASLRCLLGLNLLADKVAEPVPRISYLARVQSPKTRGGRVGGTREKMIIKQWKRHVLVVEIIHLDTSNGETAGARESRVVGTAAG